MPPIPHIKIYFSSRAQGIVKGTQCERHSLCSRDPHVGDSARCGLLGQTGQVSRKSQREADTKKITRVFCKLLDGKTHNPINETAVDEFQQGVDNLIDIAVINTVTLVQGGNGIGNGGEHIIIGCGTTAESQAYCTAGLQPNLAPWWCHSLLNVA
ncbi:hypothetical protein B0H14DRAFT_2654590 [Mycena olivaceomarginata]|nr:hypothetical protein B0H14DRAFT_2654590 [Mycena olivaceomarginata]